MKTPKLLLATKAVNAAGFAFESEIYKAHPWVNAVCHAHTVYGKAYSAERSGARHRGWLNFQPYYTNLLNRTNGDFLL